MKPKGMKWDDSKDRWDLLPFDATGLVVRVLMHGASKYADENWRYVEDGERRYFSALMRHLHAWRSGERNDPETGLPHLAHAACCALFLLARTEGDKAPHWHREVE